MKKVKRLLNCWQQCLKNTIAIISTGRVTIGAEMIEASIVNHLSIASHGLEIYELVNAISQEIGNRQHITIDDGGMYDLRDKVQDVLSEMIRKKIVKTKSSENVCVKYSIEGGEQE